MIFLEVLNDSFIEKPRELFPVEVIEHHLVDSGVRARKEVNYLLLFKAEFFPIYLNIVQMRPILGIQ